MWTAPCVSQTIRDSTMVTMRDRIPVLLALHICNGAIFNDLERPLIQISRSRSYYIASQCLCHYANALITRAE